MKSGNCEQQGAVEVPEQGNEKDGSGDFSALPSTVGFVFTERISFLIWIT